MSNDKPKFPEYVMNAMRRRRGIAGVDKSQDDAINSYSPELAFSELCKWKFGSSVWPPDFIAWLEDCGYEVKVKDEQ